MILIEIWKDIKGYKGIYKVSTYGRVKSLERIILKNNGNLQKVNERILKGTLCTRGYIQVALYLNKKGKMYMMHKLVSEAFLSNPLKKPTINHIDGNKTNNRLDNLEYATYKENMAHAWKTGLTNNDGNRKPVLMLSLDDEPLLWFDSMIEASRETNTFVQSISRCCLGKQHTAKGYKWKFYNNRKLNEV